MDQITFNELPQAIMDLNRKVDLLLSEITGRTLQKDSDKLMNVEELRSYLPGNPARQTVYDWIFKRKIPYEKYGKRVYFRKSDINNWQANARQI